MRALLVLITLTVIVTAAPTEFSKDVDTFKHNNQLGNKNSQFHRQKKSPSLPIEESSQVKDQNLEDGSKKLAEARYLGLKNPIVIEKKFGYHRLRDTEDKTIKNNCESPVKVKVCDEENETLTKSTSAAGSDPAMTEHEMENSIQMAKEAVENLHRDFLVIERNSQALNSRSDTELDSELHSNIEMARKALENIHQNIGDLESMSLKSTNKKVVPKIDSDVERLAQWKEAMENMQKNIETATNIEDDFNSTVSTKDTSEKIKTTNNLQQKSELDTPYTNMTGMQSEYNISTRKIDILPNQSNQSDKQRNRLEEKEMIHLTPIDPEQEKNLTTITGTANENHFSRLLTPTDTMAAELRRSQSGSTGPMDQLENITKDSSPISQDFESGKVESNGQLIMKSNEPMEQTFQNETPHVQGETLLKAWTQRQSTENGKQRLFDTLSMRLSENDRTKQEKLNTTETNLDNELMENNVVRMTPENNLNTQGQISFKMSPNSMMQKQNLNTHHTHMPMSVHGHHMPKQFETTDINLDQNNVNVFQNQDNSIMDMNQQQTAEDPFFMRWAVEQQQNSMGPQNAMHSRTDLRKTNMNDLENMENVHQLEMAGSDKFSPLETNIHDHDHMHLMHHANMDSSMQPSMRMNMMNMGNPTFEYNSMQWANQGLARNSYAPNAPGGPIGPGAGGQGPGAVGIFPNAKVGGCAIPLLVSCSPSLATGSLAKAQSSFSAPGYRSGDNMVYYMKRDAKEDDIPVIKVQRSHTPFVHKDEFILEAKQE